MGPDTQMPQQPMQGSTARGLRTATAQSNQINTTIAQLHEKVGLLLERLDFLREKLTPVLSNTPTPENPSETLNKDQGLVPLAQVLFEISNRVGMAINKTNEMSNQLEI